MRKISNLKSQISKVKTKKSRLFKVILFVIFVYIVFLICKDFYASSFFQKKDRVNIVFSQDQITYYSLGITDKVNYFVSFFPDLVVTVPGGYGYYRLGALVKLANLEKKQDLIKKTLSLATSSFVDFYFYPSGSSNKIEIFFGEKRKDFSLPGISLLFFGESNAHFFDKMFLYLQFLGKSKGQFKTITTLPASKQLDRTVFLSRDFFETNLGIFYKKTYRSEQRNVQILYTNSYKTAQILGQILEGEGIRVVDLSQTSSKDKKCAVIENSRFFSKTARSVSEFLGCRLVSEDIQAYDIILRLGEVEKEWEVE